MSIRDIPVPPLMIPAIMMALAALTSWALAWVGEGIKRVGEWVKRFRRTS